MNESTLKFVRFFVSILLTLGILQSPYAQYTPPDGRAYTDGELDVQPEPGKFLSLTAVDEGRDIYKPYVGDGYGYRYGPSMIRNADGSIDAYFSTMGTRGEWDWITYRHSPDSGKTWTQEVSVLEPTGDSPDFYSCCDPGIIKFGDYYYLAYTSTVNPEGLENNVFVARSKAPDGPFEKWNGNGWGGRPEPIIEYDGDPTTYGAGEPSLVVLDNILYVYYTWKDGPMNQTRVSTADATEENWPAAMQYQGVAITRRNGTYDSADIKYIEDYGKFIAVVTCERFSTDSFIGVYVSDDGLVFSESYALRTNISHCCHNCGITGRPNGHIRLSDDIYLGYAYGDQWGYWPTRLNKVEISLTDGADFSDLDNSNLKTPVVPVEKSVFVNYIGIIPDSRVYEVSKGELFVPEILKADTSLTTDRVLAGIRFYGYDEEIISVTGTVLRALSPGETFVTAEWKGHTAEFIVKVSE